MFQLKHRSQEEMKNEARWCGAAAGAVRAKMLMKKRTQGAPRRRAVRDGARAQREADKEECSDHVVLTTASLERCLDFYGRVLGLECVKANGRWAVRFGRAKLNIHVRPGEFQPAGRCGASTSGIRTETSSNSRATGPRLRTGGSRLLEARRVPEPYGPQSVLPAAALPSAGFRVFLNQSTTRFTRPSWYQGRSPWSAFSTRTYSTGTFFSLSAR